MSGGAVKVLFASGSDPVIAGAIERLKSILPDLPLVVVSEFAPPEGEWILYHVKRGWRENRALVRSKLEGSKIRIAAVILEPKTPYWRLRLIGFSLAPFYFLAFNEHGEHFMLRPRSIFTILRHLLWRLKNYLRWQFHPGGWIYTFFWRFAHPRELRRPIYYRLALLRGRRPGKRCKLENENPGEQRGHFDHQKDRKGDAHQERRILCPIVDEQLVGDIENSAHRRLAAAAKVSERLPQVPGSNNQYRPQSAFWSSVPQELLQQRGPRRIGSGCLRWIVRMYTSGQPR